jgi:hypothetical protein
VWAWVLGRPLLQNLFNVARRDPVGHFSRQLSVLGRAPERSLAQSSLTTSPQATSGQAWGRQPATKRRLQLMMALVLSVMVSAVLAAVMQGIFVWQLGLLGLMLVTYFGLAARAGAYEAERGSKVTYLNAGRTSNPVQIQAVGER